jgi:hypothetical protein
MVSTSAKLAVKGHLLRAAIRSRTAMPERTRSAAAWLELLILAQGMRCSFCCWLQPWVALPQRGATRQSRGGHKRRRGRTFEQLGQSRILAMLLLTLRGTPFFFAGDEIGMTNVPIPAQCVQDVFERRVPDERSPMRWDDSPNGGFTFGSPWAATWASAMSRA